jgi:3-polyprenyl-4-hydroxybenzoate decarboxylase
LDDIIRDVKSFSVDQVTIEYAITEIMDNVRKKKKKAIIFNKIDFFVFEKKIEALKTPRALEKFLTSNMKLLTK